MILNLIYQVKLPSHLVSIKISFLVNIINHFEYKLSHLLRLVCMLNANKEGLYIN